MNSTIGLHILIRRVAHGDKVAQAELHELTSTPLTQFVTHHFGSKFSEEDIEEIVNQSFLLMIVHSRDYLGSNGDSSAWGWAYQIARNQALKWLKITKREMLLSEMVDEDLDANDPGHQQAIHRYDPDLDSGSVEEQVLEKLFREKAFEIIRQLNPRERLILHLHFEMEWTFKQIADFIHVTPARVAQIMKNIQRKCQSAMG